MFLVSLHKTSHNRDPLVGEKGLHYKSMGPSTTVSSLGSTISTMEKIRQREDDDDTASFGSIKRRKTTEDDNKYDASQVGATELASAFALASLATLSPEGGRHHSTTDVRDVDFRDDDTSTTEARSPQEDPVPVTPELRSDLRHNRRVTFSNDTKDHERQGARRFSFPPRILREQVSRMPNGFRRMGVPNRMSLPPPPLPPLPPMHWMHQPPRQRVMVASGFMPPPPPPHPMAPSSPNSNQWICDFCNVASFATYQEACIHEETCSVRCHMLPARRAPMWHPPFPPTSHARIVSPRHPVASMEVPPVPAMTPALPSASSREWFKGATSLEIPETDADWLSELNCYIRKVCVEAFSATEDQIIRTTKRGRIGVDQVGIRCRFCAHRPAEERTVAAASFPASVAGIYESVKRWQRVHMEVCRDIPAEVHEVLGQISSVNVWIPTTRQYWVDSARALGMVDTEEGIRFAVDPNGVVDQPTKEVSSNAKNGMMDSHTIPNGALEEGKAIVYTSDYALVPAYVYFLMSQVEACRFTEADRFVARSKGPVGYPGFQCKHCSGHAGLGKYFPVSAKSLSTNSTSQNIHAHLLKCRKCPPDVKRQLIELKEEKTKAPRLEPGWRKVFFDKVWERMHG